MIENTFGMSENRVKNKFNPGGILETLKRWHQDPDQQNRWVCFDGVSVSLHDRLDGLPNHLRSICLVSELDGVLDPESHLTLTEFLYNDF
jgi:hypothetical protein